MGRQPVFVFWLFVFCLERGGENLSFRGVYGKSKVSVVYLRYS